MKHEMIIFEGVALALRDKAFGDDLALIVSEFPNKSTLNRLAGETATLITQSGDFDALREIVTIKRLLVYLAEIESLIRESATNEAAKYTSGGKLKSFEKCGAKISIKRNPVRWDYGQCAAIARRQTQIDKLKEEIEAIQTVLQTGAYIDPETGEETPQAYSIAGGNENISITL